MPLAGYSQPGTGAYGAVPQVPSPVETAGQAISGNIGNLAQIYGLGGGLNQFTTGQLRSQIGAGLPGYAGMVAQSSKDIGSLLGGQIPADVQSMLAQQAAERGIMTGGGPNQNAALLRALGLTSLGLQQTGENELTAAIGRTPVGKQFDPSTMLVTPGQQQAAQYGANVAASAPDPAAAARAAMQAGAAGLGAGMGSVPRMGSPNTNQLGSFNYGAPAPLPTNTAPGYAWAPGQAPGEAASWANWASGLPGLSTPTAGTGTTYMGPNPSDLSGGVDLGGSPSPYDYSGVGASPMMPGADQLPSLSPGLDITGGLDLSGTGLDLTGATGTLPLPSTTDYTGPLSFDPNSMDLASLYGDTGGGDMSGG